MIDWTTALSAAAATGLVQTAYWFLVRRSIERLDRDHEAMCRRVQDLEERRIAKIERDLDADGAKRKGIYEALEALRAGWVSKADCAARHEAEAQQANVFMGAVLKLERVSGDVQRLAKWVDDVSREQISAGKDISALVARLDALKNEGKPR